MRRLRYLPIFAATLALAACESEEADTPEAAEPARTGAQGEVLGGTVSDDMLPLDTLRSQSPPLSGEDDTGEGDAGEGDSPGDAEPSDGESE